MAIIACGVLIAGAIVYVNKYPAAAVAPQPQPAGTYAQVSVPAPTDKDHVYGSRTAEVFLIEYSDFQCVYCARAYPTLKQLVDQSGGQVALIHRHLPLESIHPEARPAAIASECIAEQGGDQAFWAFADAMFANQGANQGSMGAGMYSSVVDQLGLNPVAYNTCVAAGTYGALVDQHAGEAMAAGASGTPFTVIFGNGAQVGVSGAVPAAQFKAVIDAVAGRQ